MYYLLFAVILVFQLVYCFFGLGADTLDLIIVGFLTVVAGGTLAVDLARKG